MISILTEMPTSGFFFLLGIGQRKKSVLICKHITILFVCLYFLIFTGAFSFTRRVVEQRLYLPWNKFNTTVMGRVSLNTAHSLTNTSITA